MDGRRSARRCESAGSADVARSREKVCSQCGPVGGFVRRTSNVGMAALHGAARTSAARRRWGAKAFRRSGSGGGGSGSGGPHAAACCGWTSARPSMATKSGPGSESSTNTSVTLKSLRLREPSELIRARTTPFSPCRAPFRSLVGDRRRFRTLPRHRSAEILSDRRRLRRRRATCHSAQRCAAARARRSHLD
jgi:hypothetical protein